MHNILKSACDTAESDVDALVLRGASGVKGAPHMELWQAVVMGLVEGFTEYLPVSSTGHLIIASELMGLRAVTDPKRLEALQAFEIVIQGGAILAVAFAYFEHCKQMLMGIFGYSSAGRDLLGKIIVATVPILCVGYLMKDFISHYLQHFYPVLFAVFAGGILILWVDTPKDTNRGTQHGIQALSLQQALLIGLAQCLALWPGTSRSMITILVGTVLGLRRASAAEFSFLLGLPALLSATLYKGYKSGHVLIEQIEVSFLLAGLVVSFFSALVAVKWLVRYLGRHNMRIFGWYRIALGCLMLVFK